MSCSGPLLENKSTNCDHIERCSLRFLCLLTAPQTASNMHAQVSRAQSCTNHMQHIDRLSGMPIFCYFPFFPLFLARSVLRRPVFHFFPPTVPFVESKNWQRTASADCSVDMLIFSIFSYFIFLFLNFLSLFVFIFCETARTRRFSVIFAKIQWHPWLITCNMLCATWYEGTDILLY